MPESIRKFLRPMTATKPRTSDWKPTECIFYGKKGNNYAIIMMFTVVETFL